MSSEGDRKLTVAGGDNRFTGVVGARRWWSKGGEVVVVW